MHLWIVFTSIGVALIILFFLGCLRVSRFTEEAERRDIEHAER